MENKLFGAVKLEDLDKPAEEAPKAEESAAPSETSEVSDSSETPKMGEQKNESEPAEIIVPKMPGEKSEEAPKGENETAFRMDMMVEAEESIDASKGIFSGDPTVQKTITPIESANTWHDNTSFKEKTATHAEKVFETDKDDSLREEQEEKKKEEIEKAAAEEGAKRAKKAWGVRTADAMVEETPKEEVKTAEEPSKSAPVTPEERDEPASTGIFSAAPKKTGGFFAKIKEALTKPVGKKKAETPPAK